MTRRRREQGNRRNKRAQAPARWRGYFVLSIFAVFAVALAGRAFELQVLDQAFLIHQGDMRHLRSVAVPAGRGAIRDRNGEPLALSAPTESVWAVPGAVLEAPEKIAPLARNLGMSPADLREELESHRNRQFLYLKRQLSPADALDVTAVDAPGIFLQREYKRYYPAGEAAAQLVGLVNIDGRGQLGMELDKNSFLHGESGSRRVIKDRLGRVVEDLAKFEPAEPGHDLRLTIDSRLQSIAYRQIKAAVLNNDANGGLVVILDPDNGQLLASASYPSFNPNDRSTITPERMRARAAIDLMEPGSTIKPLLLAQALDSEQFSVNSRIDTSGGHIRVGRLDITDYSDYGNASFATILKKSSNIGAALVGLAMGPEKVWRAYHDFGIGATTGTGFPGERYGILKDYYRWAEVETATASYGYGVALTAFQLIRAYGAIANGGRLHELRMIIGPGAHMHPPARQVISPVTARQIRRMLEGVVSSEGTAPRAAIPGYRVAGKTGTARKAGDGGYSEDRHQALFVGMVPAQDPELVALVMLDEPSDGAYYGGAVAAPVFSDVIRKALRLLHIPPTHPDMLAAGHGDGPGAS